MPDAGEAALLPARISASLVVAWVLWWCDGVLASARHNCDCWVASRAGAAVGRDRTTRANNTNQDAAMPVARSRSRGRYTCYSALWRHGRGPFAYGTRRRWYLARQPTRPRSPIFNAAGWRRPATSNRPLLTQRYPTNRWVPVQRPALVRRQGSAVDEEEAGRCVLVLLLMA